MPSGTATGSLYLIDAHSLIFQVFHAIRGMSSPSGLPTNALFGFTRDLLFLRKLRPDCLLCAFDRPEPTFRSDIYPAYKANREAMPDDLQLQIPLIHQVLDALAIPAVSHRGYEADDVLATVAVEGAKRGLDVFLCTSDKDCRQLIDDHIRLYSLRKRQEFGREDLLTEWGVTPEQVVDLQTLVGDSVDNVPGVKGIGLKTGAKLLQEFGTLENLLAHIEQVPGPKKQEALRAARDTIETTQACVRLRRDVPVQLDWEAWKLREPDVPRLLALFQEWGFHSLASQLREAPRPDVPTQGVLFDENGLPVEELFPFGANAPALGGVEVLTETGRGSWEATYHLVDTPPAFEAFFKKLRRQKRIDFDVETTSLQPLEAELVGIALTWKAGEAWYLPLRGPEGSALLDPAALGRLKEVLEDPDVAKVNQNIKYDLLVLRANGINPRGVAGDPMVAHYLLHAGERSHNLEELARQYLNHQVTPITALIGKKAKKQPQLRMDQVPTERVADYAGEDADAAWRLCDLLEQQLEQVEAAAPEEAAADGKEEKKKARKGTATLRKLYDEVEVPLIEVLAELEFNGIRLDIPLLEKLGAEMGRQLEAIENEIYTLAGHAFNIGSLVQLRKVLFEELKLPVQGKTGVTGVASTDQETLEKLAALDHPNNKLPAKILEHRQVAKLKSTYVDALPAMVNPTTGRVHASFNQTVTVTGRLSSSDPNLQNIPVRREQGQQIRQAFLPAPGWVLLTADYSQIELRLLAHFCGDEELRRAFAEERDVHAAVAGQIFGVGEADVTPQMRRMAKTVNFGVIYGISPPGLAQRLHIPKDEAERFIAAYFARYPKVQEYQSRLLHECRRTGFVSTILGRRRRFDPVAIRETSTYRQRNQAEREAINMEVQGSAADLMKLAMLNVYRRLRREGRAARMLLQIHDELVFEVPPEELNALAGLVCEEMTGPVEKTMGLRVPLRVDLAAGPNWLDVEEIRHGPRETEGGAKRRTAPALDVPEDCCPRAFFPCFPCIPWFPMTKKPVVGLVGGIGSGKSRVAGVFAGRGARVVSGDELAHAALRQPEVRAQVARRWGPHLLDEHGEVRRRALGEIVFSDPDQRRALEAMVHPWIMKRIREEVAAAQADPAVQLVVLDAAVMLEAGWDGVCDRLVYVEAPRELRLARVAGQRGWTARELEAREGAQLPLTAKAARADHVLDNSASLEHLGRQVDDLLRRWGLTRAAADGRV